MSDARCKNRLAKAVFVSVLIAVFAMSARFSVRAATTECNPGEHRYVITASTDTDTTYTCELCGNWYTELLAHDSHKWGEWVIEVEADCTKTGYMRRACMVHPDLFEYRSILAIGHVYDTVIREPTCSGPGVKIYTCAGCGHSYTEPFGAATAHSYRTTIQEPTCTGPGVITHTCAGCGHSYAETFGTAAAHSYRATAKGPTCTEKGVYVYVCLHCGYRYNQSYGEAAGHSYLEKTVTAATCEQAGETVFLCQCGDSYTETIPALGHVFGPWITDVEAVEGAEGLRHRECEHGCGATVSEVTAAIVPVRQPLLNKTDLVIGSVNLTLLAVFAALLIPMFSTLLWVRKKELVFLAKKKQEGEEKRKESARYDYR